MNYELKHYGTKGMEWGKRRWQNEDGSLTPAGKIRYGNADKDFRDQRSKDTDDTFVRNSKYDYTQFAKAKTAATQTLKQASTKKGIENFLTGSLLEIRPMSTSSSSSVNTTITPGSSGRQRNTSTNGKGVIKRDIPDEQKKKANGN